MHHNSSGRTNAQTFIVIARAGDKGVRMESQWDCIGLLRSVIWYLLFVIRKRTNNE